MIEGSIYGIFILIGLGFGFIPCYWFGIKNKVSKDDIFFSYLFAALGAAAGGKILYLIISSPYIIRFKGELFSDIKNIEGLIKGGFVYYGGFFGALVVVYKYCKRYRLDFWNMCRMLIPSIPIAHSFGRIGCFFSGCCYGIVSDCFFSINGRVPVQIIEAIMNVTIAYNLIRLRKMKDGRYILKYYCVIYCVGRFFLEFFRGDEIRGSYFEVSLSQWISIAIILFLIFNYVKRFKGQSV